MTTFFTGYDPRYPTRLVATPSADLSQRVRPLEIVRDVIRHSKAELAYLLERCHPSVNATPAAFLAPSTLRHLVENRAFDLAAQVTSIFPSSTVDRVDIELGFFSLAEALVESSPGLPTSLAADLRACLWIDRRLFRLHNVHLKMRAFAGHPGNVAESLLEQHIEELRGTLEQRRPVLGSNYVRLTGDTVPLLTGRPPQPGRTDVLCYANPSGVHYLYLSPVESMLLDLCDGRAFPEIVEETCCALQMDRAEVENGLFEFLGRLARMSVLLVDWSLS